MSQHLPARASGGGAVSSRAGSRIHTDLEATIGWMHAGTAICRRAAEGLSDADAAAPSGLPNWTRAHVLTHLARNADALVNLLNWARTGVPTPMYASPAQRQADIEAGAGRSATALRADLNEASKRLAEAVAEMRPGDWRATVRTAQGREVPASLVPWLRTREVWLHAVDLATGIRMTDVPPDLVDALLDDVTAGFASRADSPALLLRAIDRDRSWSVVRPGAEPVEITGTAADLLGWLTGRGPATRLTVGTGSSPVPVLPPWL